MFIPFWMMLHFYMILSSYVFSVTFSASTQNHKFFHKSKSILSTFFGSLHTENNRDNIPGEWQKTQSLYTYIISYIHNFTYNYIYNFSSLEERREERYGFQGIGYFNFWAPVKWEIREERNKNARMYLASNMVNFERTLKGLQIWAVLEDEW